MATKTAQKAPESAPEADDIGGQPMSGNLDDYLDDAIAFASGEAAPSGETTPPKKEEEAPAAKEEEDKTPASGGEKPAGEGDAPPTEDDPPADGDKPAGEKPEEDDPPADGDTPAGEKPAGEDTSEKFDPEKFGKDLVDAVSKATASRQEEKPEEDDLDEDVPVTVDDFLEDEDREKLKAFDNEWSEVSEAMNARLNQHINYTQHQVLSQVARVLAPVAQQMQQLQVSQQRAAVQSAHSDYKDLLPGVKDWIGKQPAIVRGSLDSVLQRGNADQVIQLFDAYKEATKGQRPAPETPGSPVTDPAPKTQEKPKEKPKPSKEALEATTGVQSERKPNQAVDKDDFGAALGEAINNL